MFSFQKSLAVFFGLLLVIALLSAMLPLVGRGQGGGLNPLKRDTRTAFYVTEASYNGSQALTACTDGYHMASMWEILDPSNLRYNTQLGATWPDSGFGPPTASASEPGFGLAAQPLTVKLLVSVTATRGPAQAKMMLERSSDLISPGMPPAKKSVPGLPLRHTAMSTCPSGACRTEDSSCG